MLSFSGMRTTIAESPFSSAGYSSPHSALSTAVLAPFVSLFAFVCRPSYDDYDPDDMRRGYYDRRDVDDYDDDRDDHPVVIPPGYGRRDLRRRRLRR